MSDYPRVCPGCNKSRAKSGYHQSQGIMSKLCKTCLRKWWNAPEGYPRCSACESSRFEDVSSGIVSNCCKAEVLLAPISTK